MFRLLATTQAASDPATANTAGVVAGVLVIVLIFGVFGIINWLVVDAAKAATPEHQTMKPGLFWLMMIPLFNIFWAFKAMPAVSNSLKATLDDKGQPGADVGRTEGLIFAWLGVVHVLEVIITGQPFGDHRLIPGLISGFMALVSVSLLIIYTVKVRRAKSRIVSAG